MSYNIPLYLDYLQTPQLYEMMYINEFFLVVMPNYKDIAHHNTIKTAKKKVSQLTHDVAGQARKLQKIDAKIAQHRKTGNVDAISKLQAKKQAIQNIIQKKIVQAKQIKAGAKTSAEYIRKQEIGRKKLNKAIANTAKKIKNKAIGTTKPAPPKITPATKKVIQKIDAAVDAAPVKKVVKPPPLDLGGAAKKALKTTGKIGLVAGASAAAAYGGYKIYQRYLSQAAKSCKGKGGAERSLCIKQYMQARRSK